MKIRTPTDLGALIRDRRAKMALDQTSLAQRVGASRKWLVEAEHGNPGASIGLILRTLQALGVSLEVNDGRGAPLRRGTSVASSIDIDQHLERFRRKP
jgi:HTH-type transcriptional regulator / antitoxin HipB